MYNKSLGVYMKLLKIERELGNESKIAYTLDLIGSLYKNMKEYNKSLKHYNQSLELKKSIGNKKSEAITLNNIGTLFLEQKNIVRH